jgi:hypothetical protein
MTETRVVETYSKGTERGTYQVHHEYHERPLGVINVDSESESYTGTVRDNPDGVHLVPHVCFNEDGTWKREFRFTGGKKPAFMEEDVSVPSLTPLDQGANFNQIVAAINEMQKSIQQLGERIIKIENGY